MKKGKRIASGGRVISLRTKKNTESQEHSEESGDSRKKPSIFGKYAPVLRKYRLFIILGIVLLAAGLIALAVHDLLKPPSLNEPILPPPISHGGDESGAPYNSANPSGQPVNTEVGIVEPPKLVFNEDIRTILGVALFDGSNTDTMMIGVLDHSSNTLKVLSIPRDTAITFNGRLNKINSVHNRSASDEKIDNLRTEIARVIGFYPNFDVLVRANAFKRLVDSVGGIDFNVPVNMYVKWENIDLKKGQQKLNGEKALMLLRYRGYASSNSAGIPGNDYGRMYMQQQFLTAVAKQVLTVKNIGKIPEFVENFNENVSTSLVLSDMTYFANEIIQCADADKIEFYTLPTKDFNTYHDDGELAGAYQAIVLDEALAMLNEHFNPYNSPITAEMLQLSYYYPTRNEPIVRP